MSRRLTRILVTSVAGAALLSAAPAVAGTSLRKTVHIGDNYNPVSPETLPDRLRSAGFTDVYVDTKGGEQRWRAVKA